MLTRIMTAMAIVIAFALSACSESTKPAQAEKEAATVVATTGETTPEEIYSEIEKRKAWYAERMGVSEEHAADALRQHPFFPTLARYYKQASMGDEGVSRAKMHAEVLVVALLKDMYISRGTDVLSALMDEMSNTAIKDAAALFKWRNEFILPAIRNAKRVISEAEDECQQKQVNKKLCLSDMEEALSSLRWLIENRLRPASSNLMEQLVYRLAIDRKD